MSPRVLSRYPEGYRPKHVALCFVVITQDAHDLTPPLQLDTAVSIREPNFNASERDRSL